MIRKTDKGKIMRVAEQCVDCLYRKQVRLAQVIPQEQDRASYLKEIRGVLERRRPQDSAPYLVYLFGEIQNKYGIPEEVFQKEKYNAIVLSMEQQIEAQITASADPLLAALRFARSGNYIDFGAMDEVRPDVLLKLLQEGEDPDAETYAAFCKACRSGSTFLLLCDNCGEIVLDKLFIRQLKKCYPQLTVYAMVRGAPTLNDATREDAEACGMGQEAILISSGSAVAGTVPEQLSAEAYAVLEHADVILSKGQGNYESLSGWQGNVFYSFLCKCDLFTQRFQVPRFTGMFFQDDGRNRRRDH